MNQKGTKWIVEKVMTTPFRYDRHIACQCMLHQICMHNVHAHTLG